MEDDDTVASVLVSYLERAGHQAKHVTDGQAAADLIAEASTPPDLIVLDLMLPMVDGLEVCRRVRRTHPELPVIMLTALSESEDRIAGLEVGADDYVTKPFSPRELILRIESRCCAAAHAARQPSQLLTAGTITVDQAARRAHPQRRGGRAHRARARVAGSS